MTSAKEWTFKGEAKKLRNRASTASVNLDNRPALVDSLNDLDIFDGQIRFKNIRRRGTMIIATTSKDEEIVWPTTAELASFSKARAIIADTTGVYLTLPYGQIKTTWDAIVSLIVRIAATDAVALQSPLKEEARDLLRLMWQRSGEREAETSEDFVWFMARIREAKRSVGDPPPSVFIAEERTWIHVPTLRMWLSTPSFTNKLWPLPDLRNGLLLLGCTYSENVTRRCANTSEKLCLWSGPVLILKG